MQYAIKLHDEQALVHRSTRSHPLSVRLVRESGTAYRLPAADAYAKRLAEEAERWLDHVRERSRMKEETLVRKALHSVAFSLRHRAHDLAVPTKLAGTAKHQRQLWEAVRARVPLGTPLDIHEERDGQGDGGRVRLAVSHDGERLGEVQPKHVGWFAPLVPFGAGVFLTRVTGHETEGYRLGMNVCFGRVGGAVSALRHALGTDLGGDGSGPQSGAEAAVALRPVPAPARVHGGDGAAGSPPALASEDVRLWRDRDGTAHASVPHAVRHSPTGVEWGYGGSGPADLARSVLLRFADEATAERLYQLYKAEVIARVPEAGGTIRAADVRAWLAVHTDGPC